MGNDEWGKSVTTDQALITHMAFGVPVILYAGFPAFAEHADNVGCVPIGSVN